MAAAGTLEPKGASVPSSTVNLAKNIVGAGVLALASGVSSFSSRRAALPPALAIMLALCSMSGYTFSVIARVGNAVGASSYRDTWAKVFGESVHHFDARSVSLLCTAFARAAVGGAEEVPERERRQHIELGRERAQPPLQQLRGGRGLVREDKVERVRADGGRTHPQG